MFTRVFWKDAFERVVSTAAQAFLSVVGVGALDVMTFDWGTALSITAGAAVLSLVKALAAGKFQDDTVSPASLVSTEGEPVA